jgi:hypothetical protein
MADAKRGLEIVRGTPADVEGLTYWTVGREPAETRAARVHLLPIYDEYIVAYRDRAAVPHRSERLSPLAAGLTFQHALVVNGQIAGTWKVRRSRTGIAIQPIPRRTLTRPEARSLSTAVTACEEFFRG